MYYLYGGFIIIIIIKIGWLLYGTNHTSLGTVYRKMEPEVQFSLFKALGKTAI